jgi:hypothetical protein
MIRIEALFGLALLLVWLFAIFDAITAPAEQIRLMPKVLWVLVIIFVWPLGAIAWFLWGRPVTGQPDAASRSVSSRLRPPQSLGGPSRAPRRPIAPDDDPDFLRSL